MKFIILSLLFVAVTAAPTQFENDETILSNALIESNEILDSPMIDFEIDYELNKFEYVFLPDEIRDGIVEQLRLGAVQINLKILDLIKKMDREIEKLANAHVKTNNAFIKGKVWSQIHSLKLLRTVTRAGLDKFEQYIVSENSNVLENFVRALENLLEAKFGKFTTIAKTSFKLLKSMNELEANQKTVA